MSEKATALILIGRDEAAELVRAGWEYVSQRGTIPPRPAEVLLVSAIDKLTRAFENGEGHAKRT